MNLHPLRIFSKADAPPATQDKHWYNLAVSGEAEQRVIEVYVYGEIGGWGITANQFVRDLAALDDGVSQVSARFNSIGGDLFDGLAIHNALARLGERCTGHVDALAASAASVAVCGAHKVVIAANAMLMIHNPWTYASGDAEGLRKVATALDQATEVIIAAYKSKAPDIDEIELRRMVNAETWLTANESVALGLADEVGEGVKVKACIGQGGALQRFQNAPKALLDQLDEPPEPPTPDDPPVVPVVQDSAKLAVMITQHCNKAGIGNLVEPLIASTKLASESVVMAALARASAVHDLCIAARLPELTAEYVVAGLDADAVRVRLFDKLVKGGGFEIDNSQPLATDPPPKTQAKQPDHTNIYAARKAAQTPSGKRS
ncbi:head maturation protease, ClpP-related [Pseudomonas sp. GM67]|uniref:head maturation protease, ClpP-related n=1 Tax=Pseudomonas sp. GM67 TaxID=1144335 RepID=UPI000270CB17|nr:head maturation protease, ClpP-related [Pseudomonas sp. GM67]EJM94728.1 protease subunit of ATP-dependent protease [Pseudomonas sp. GM67]